MFINERFLPTGKKYFILVPNRVCRLQWTFDNNCTDDENYGQITLLVLHGEHLLHDFKFPQPHSAIAVKQFTAHRVMVVALDIWPYSPVLPPVDFFTFPWTNFKKRAIFVCRIQIHVSRGFCMAHCFQELYSSCKKSITNDRYQFEGI